MKLIVRRNYVWTANKYCSIRFKVTRRNADGSVDGRCHETGHLYSFKPEQTTEENTKEIEA
jgi:hypothetical protein